MNEKKQLIEKVYKNALIGERLYKLTPVERQKIILRLLEGRSERDLADEIGIPRSTINDWRTLRQDNTGENIHVSLSLIIRRLRNFKPTISDDYVKLHEIKNIVEEKLDAKEEKR